eukprot:CAMPEP_0174367808 /NCGR_PEP_ID=MMETSP0811_2-20130205/86748_1 /TAXON_ID=73025 ORGANISM="Eutreptiella gymnastica-like, Strain CCMP1594" /NCGR_SAMPLE_ID=MMETSP0811_2 /ASSEMBLY_ACC=CAM_ASM_000667 /LENGTH=73 /DNA_ID=CAMNT_0015510723 /DNA_START=716 /DNA_END=933 /DNA_ORIENTATION=-
MQWSAVRQQASALPLKTVLQTGGQMAHEATDLLDYAPPPLIPPFTCISSGDSRTRRPFSDRFRGHFEAQQCRG